MFSQNMVTSSTDSSKISEQKAIPLKELYTADYQKFVTEIQNIIPESKYLNESAQQSLAVPLGANKNTSHYYGLTQAQAIRAFAGLIAFKDAYIGTIQTYSHFVGCQKELGKPVLTYESFQEMHSYIHNKVKTDQDLLAITWSILCNDLGQVNKIGDIYFKKLKGAPVSHDIILSQVLTKLSDEEKVELFPSFMKLDRTLQAHITDGYASGCDPSQLEESELPLVSLSGLKSLSIKSLDFYILHSIFDVAGAAPHFDFGKKGNDGQPLEGFSTMHQDTWSFFNNLRQTVELFYKKNACIEDVYYHYLNFRGQYKRDNDTAAINILDNINNQNEIIALSRLLCLSRIGSNSEAMILKNVWDNLDTSPQSKNNSSEKTQFKEILITELSTPGNQGRRAIFVAWSAAIFSNPRSHYIENGFSQETAMAKGLRVTLITLAKIFDATRKSIPGKSNNIAKPFVAFCPQIATHLKNSPTELINFKFKEFSNDIDGIPRRSALTVVHSFDETKVTVPEKLAIIDLSKLIKESHIPSNTMLKKENVPNILVPKL